MVTLPTEDDPVFSILLSYLRLLHKSLLLVPDALEMNTTTSRDFACRVIIVASYRFPSFRSTLLECVSEILPSRFHMDASFVDMIEFRTPEKSVCDQFDQFNNCYESSLEKSQSRCYLSSILDSSHCIVSRLLSL